MNLTNSPTPSPSSAACSRPGAHLGGVGQRRLDRVDRAALRNAVARADGDRVEARLAEHRCAVSTSKSAIVAPPRLSTSPKRAMPVSVNARDRPVAGDLHRVADLEVVLVGGLEVDHDLVRAGRPGAFDELERVESLVGRSMPRPKVGLSPLDRLAVPVEDLACSSRPRGRGSSRLRPRPPGGRAPRALRVRPGPCRSATTRRSSCRRRRRPSRSYELEKMLSNALSIVSVRTSVPLTIATPRTIASPSGSTGACAPSSPLSATRSSVRDLGEGLEDLVPATSGRAPRRSGRRPGRASGRRSWPPAGRG